MAPFLSLKSLSMVEFTPVIQIRGFDLPPHVAQSS